MHDSHFLPFRWDLNVYRGCSHRCAYCYAFYSHDYLNEADFGKVFVKKNILECLERELASPEWTREVVNLGGVTDNYQEAEAHLRIMPEVWRLLIKYKTPAVISTKSELILRDYDLIAELAATAEVSVAFTVTSTDENMQKLFEPGASAPFVRLSALAELTGTKAHVGLHMMPIIPFITDGQSAIESVFAGAANAGVHYIIPSSLNLIGTTRQRFFKFIEDKLPEKARALRELYKTSRVHKSYKAELYKKINPLYKRYGFQVWRKE